MKEKTGIDVKKREGEGQSGQSKRGEKRRPVKRGEGMEGGRDSIIDVLGTEFHNWRKQTVLLFVLFHSPLHKTYTVHIYPFLPITILHIHTHLHILLRPNYRYIQ